MDKSLRKTILAGNWKMNKTRPEAKALIEGIKPLAENADCEVVICVPFTNLETAVEMKIGVEYVIIGHSERRQYFGETDETVNKRTKAALAAGLKPIVCVGELLWERECGITEEVVARQIKLDLFDVSADDVKKTVIAYEPVWAIGTGKVATSEQAEEVCKLIRDTLAKLYSQDVANAVTIQYGGSMNPANCEELLAQYDVDGGLIGGASLKADQFGVLIAAASK